MVHHRTGDWVAELELAPEHQGSAAGFLFHPALFEAGLLGGGVGLGMLHSDNDGPGLYLPLMFERFRAAGPLGGRCYVRVPADSVRRDEELIRLVVEFYDAQGAKVAEVGQFVAKRIRAAAALDVRGGTPTPAEPRPAGGRSGDLVDVVRSLVAARLEVAADRVDVGSGYYELGLASADLLSLVADLEERLSVELSPTVMFEYRTIAELAAWLEPQVPAQVLATATAPTAPVPPASVPPSAPAAGSVPVPAVPSSAVRGDDPLAGLRADLTNEVAAFLGVAVADVHADAELAEFGLDVNGLARLADRVGARLGLTIAPGVFREHRTLNALAGYLSREHRALSTAVPAPRSHPLLPRPSPATATA
ncbi:phosphopantetheine-binding protein [Streptomyces sp. GD-15H]|uniref:phosphopantetheine-binding protein n=1 Tax=Streptomyces sp. GD-15H TaxID=3129112 RepID=UPI003246CD2C